MPIAVIAFSLMTLFVTAETGWAETARAGRGTAGLSERAARAEARSRAQTMAICEGCGVSLGKRRVERVKIASGTRTRSKARSTTLWSSDPGVAVREPCGGTSSTSKSRDGPAAAKGRVSAADPIRAEPAAERDTTRLPVPPMALARWRAVRRSTPRRARMYRRPRSPVATGVATKPRKTPTWFAGDETARCWLSPACGQSGAAHAAPRPIPSRANTTCSAS